MQHIWKNNKIRSKYDLLRFTAKNDGWMKYTDEELDSVDLKAKAFQGIKDNSIKRLVELAYIIGNLQGMIAADKELEADNKIQNSTQQTNHQTGKQNSNREEKEQKTEYVQEERLYVVGCKVKNRQDKIAYVTHCVKSGSEETALSAASTECGMRNQTMIKGKVIKTYANDSMQFQFGIGQKEMDTLSTLGKKYLS